VTAVLLGVAYAVFGLAVGAFLNVVVDRVPDKIPLRAAGQDDPVRHLSWAGLPVQPWLLRRGRGGGDERLPLRWVGVEILTVVTFAALGVRYGTSLTVVPLLVLAACLVSVSVIDLQVLRIPDRITFPTLGVTVVLIVAVSLLQGHPDAIRGALAGMVGYFVMLIVPHLVYPRGMGFGDVKLALVMGLHLGWLGWSSAGPLAGPARLVLYALLLGSMLGAVFGGAVAVATKHRGAFPFGPALAVACLVVVLLAPELRL
jgi:leader peptidase (prepilin peptidase) / N-methyltransferase